MERILFNQVSSTLEVKQNLSEKKELNSLDKSKEARKIMKSAYMASVDDLIYIIEHSKESFEIANQSFNFGYYQGYRAGIQKR